MNKRSKYNKGKQKCIYINPINQERLQPLLMGKSLGKELVKTYLEKHGLEYYEAVDK